MAPNINTRRSGDSALSPSLSRSNDGGDQSPTVAARSVGSASGSIAKRLNMFARWMMARAPMEGIDFGLWAHVPTRLLVMPVDTHVHRIARLVGLTSGKTASWRTALELTEALRRFDPDDPVRFDFALAHLGISGVHGARYEETVCPGCALRQVCTAGGATRGSDA